jgi:hypothetical protein
LAHTSKVNLERASKTPLVLTLLASIVQCGWNLGYQLFRGLPLPCVKNNAKIRPNG